MFFFIPKNASKVICFIHNKKTGGTSIHDTFKYSKLGNLYPNRDKQIVSQEDEATFKKILPTFNSCFDYVRPRYDPKNMPGAHINFEQSVLYLLRCGVPPETIKDKVVFCTIVRNPFDRLESWWHHLKRDSTLGNTDYIHEINSRFIDLCYDNFDKIVEWKRVVNSLKCQHDYYKDCKISYKNKIIDFKFKKENILRNESLQNDFDEFMVRNFNLKLEPLRLVNARKGFDFKNSKNEKRFKISFDQVRGDIRRFENKVIQDFYY